MLAQDAGWGRGKMKRHRKPKTHEALRSRTEGTRAPETRFRLMTAIRGDFFQWSIFCVRAVAAPLRVVVAPSSRKKREGDEGRGGPPPHANERDVRGQSLRFYKNARQRETLCGRDGRATETGGFFQTITVAYREVISTGNRGRAKTYQRAYEK